MAYSERLLSCSVYNYESKILTCVNTSSGDGGDAVVGKAVPTNSTGLPVLVDAVSDSKGLTVDGRSRFMNSHESLDSEVSSKIEDFRVWPARVLLVSSKVSMLFIMSEFWSKESCCGALVFCERASRSFSLPQGHEVGYLAPTYILLLPT